jgi:hypothetical protein
MEKLRMWRMFGRSSIGKLPRSGSVVGGRMCLKYLKLQFERYLIGVFPGTKGESEVGNFFQNFLSERCDPYPLNRV